MNVLSRVFVVPVAALTMAAFSLPGWAVADPTPTQVITVMAVGPAGQPINGYQESQAQGNVVTVEGCEPSPSAVADNVYSCAPTAAGAGTCWESTPGSLLCVNDPWDKR